MTKNKQRLWIFFIILLYVIIAVVGFVIAYIVKGVIFEPKKPTSTQTTPLTKNVTPSLTIPGWKTYTDTNDSITFSYPATDTIKPSTYGFGVTSFAIHTVNENLDFQILVVPQTLATAVGQNFDSYYTMPNNTTKTIKSPLAKNNTSERFTKIRNLSVNGLDAVDYQSIASDAKPGTQPEIGTIIKAGSNLILLSTDKNNKAKLEKLLTTITYNN